MPIPYVTQADIASEIPETFLVQALDDDGDGVADAWDKVAASVQTDIDGYLGIRFPLPLAEPYPAFVLSSAKTLACEKCYKRRGITDAANPWASQASQARTLLKAMALSEAPLSPTTQSQNPSASVITQPLRTVPQGGRDRINT